MHSSHAAAAAADAAASDDVAAQFRILKIQLQNPIQLPPEGRDVHIRRQMTMRHISNYI